MKRNNLITGVIGRRGSGKTHWCLNTIIPIYRRKDFKVLIIDSIDHPDYQKFQFIKPAQFPRWTSGVARWFGNESELMESVLPAISLLNKVAIIHEDCRKYFSSAQMPVEVRNYIIDSKQRNTDLFFLYHSWMYVHMDIFRQGDYLTIFRTVDGPEKRKDVLANYESALTAHRKLKRDPQPYPQPITIPLE